MENLESEIRKCMEIIRDCFVGDFMPYQSDNLETAVYRLSEIHEQHPEYFSPSDMKIVEQASFKFEI